MIPDEKVIESAKEIRSLIDTINGKIKELYKEGIDVAVVDLDEGMGLPPYNQYVVNIWKTKNY